MLPLAKKWWPTIPIGIVSAWLASRADLGDWPSDGGPAVEALGAGHVGQYLSSLSLSGPFANLIQAPFVALSGGSGAVAYRWAAFPCLFAAGLVGLYLAKIAGRRGAPAVTQILLPLILLLNPLTLEALATGHPEEILAAALAIAAIAAAAEKRPAWAAVLLGLAIASKQWAVIAILPALLVLPSHRLRAGAGAAAVVALLFLPNALASPDSFFELQRAASGTPEVATPWSVWHPAGNEQTMVHQVDGQRLVGQVQRPPALAASFSHSLIVLLALALPLLLARRRGLPLIPSDGFALLALIALLRCALDPVDNLYYHAPLLLALIGWDAFSSKGLPLRSLLALAVSILFWQEGRHLTDPAAFNSVYLAVVSVLGFALVSSLFARIDWTGVPVSAVFAGRNPNFRD